MKQKKVNSRSNDIKKTPKGKKSEVSASKEVKKSETNIQKTGYKTVEIESSYRENDLGKTLYDLVMELKPKTIIEFGTLNGYSAVAMAQALRDLGAGHIISYDLWDLYKHKHGVRSLVQDEIDRLGLSKYITLETGDFKHWQGDADLVHVDISNDGETIKMLKSKGITGTVIFEGGSVERDRVQWMTKYNKPPIRSSGVRFDVIDERFPSISKLI